MDSLLLSLPFSPPLPPPPSSSLSLSLHSLSLSLSPPSPLPYRHFEVKDKSDEKDASKIFSVPDFVGDACKAIASRVRGAVAGVAFDDFHKVCVPVFSVRCLN